MLKLLIAGRRAPGKTREAALAHLRTVHGPLVYDASADAGAMPSRYEQNHVFDGPDVPALRSFLSDRDLVTEIWFETMDHLREATTTPYYKNVLQPDEGNFVDQATVLKGAVAESGAWGTPPADAAKLFVFLKRSAATTREAFEQSCSKVFGEDLASGSEVRAAVANTLLPPPGGGEPYADRVAELWFASRSAAEGFCTAGLPAILTEDLSGVIDSTASFYVLADAYPVERLRAVAAAAAA